MGRPLSSLDRFQIVTTVLFIGLGLIIVLRSLTLAVARHETISPLAFVFGIALAVYGLYRLRLIRARLERRDRGDQR